MAANGNSKVDNALMRTSTIGTAGSFGMFLFATTTFIHSCFNLQTQGIHTPNLVISITMFFGGFGQVLAGMWEFPRGNVFGGTAFASYGVFWMSYAVTLLPGIESMNAYNDNADVSNALGIFLLAWSIVTLSMLIGAWKKNWGVVLLFGFLGITFLLSAVGKFTGNRGYNKAGGVTGLLSSTIAYLAGVNVLLSSEEISVVVARGVVPKRMD